MKQHRDSGPILPAAVGLILLIWGIWVLFTAFRYGSLPVAGWRTEQNLSFGLVWFIAYSVVLLPAYTYAISLGRRAWRRNVGASEVKHSWRASIGVTTLLVVLTFCTRVAVTAWFPSPMHPPFQVWQGGRLAGFLATMILLLVEAGVLIAMKHQTAKDQRPAPLMIPGFLAFIQFLWACWIIYTAFSRGEFPTLDWQTENHVLFGWIWTAAALVVLFPAYVYGIALGLLGWLERNHEDKVETQNYWLVAIGMSALLYLLTFCTRMAVTAWFNSPIHPPFNEFTGGVVPGAIATLGLSLLVIAFHKVARSF